MGQAATKLGHGGASSPPARVAVFARRRVFFPPFIRRFVSKILLTSAPRHRRRRLGRSDVRRRVRAGAEPSLEPRRRFPPHVHRRNPEPQAQVPRSLQRASLERGPAVALTRPPEKISGTRNDPRRSRRVIILITRDDARKRRLGADAATTRAREPRPRERTLAIPDEIRSLRTKSTPRGILSSDGARARAQISRDTRRAPTPPGRIRSDVRRRRTSSGSPADVVTAFSVSPSRRASRARRRSP
jgi:hypothetical protein